MKVSVLARIDSEPPARVWSGVGDLTIPADQVEEEDALYLGGGQLVSVPELEQLINGTASRIAVSLSGVSTETQRLALEDAETVKSAAVNIGLVHFDDDYQITEVEWLAELRADSLGIDNTSTETGRTRSITLSIGSDLTDRSKAPLAFFTDADQRRRSADDAIFDHVPGINAGTSRPFGPR